MNQELINDLAQLSRDPLGFVYWAFPWGDGMLKDQTGPEPWQKDVLKHIGEHLSGNNVVREAVASGHGIGKSALVAWLILWAMATHENTRGVVTANTEAQLTTKTWPELVKWHALFIANPMFKVTATAMFSTEPGHEKNWRVDAIPWSVERSEAFAGLHNRGNRTILIFDEASAIDDKIWEVAEGALTDAGTERMWCAFGNPTRNTGRFYDCFHRFRAHWNTQRVDSRSVSFSDKRQIREWAEAYGEDSDFFRVRVAGQFPAASETQFISRALVEAAAERNPKESQYDFAPVIIGVDPAWTGGDATAIYLRQGLYSKKLARLQKNDNDYTLAQMIARFEDQYHADAVNIDLGYGTGVYSAGTTMGRNWRLVPFGEASPDPACRNMRAYMWNKMRKWLVDGGAIPKDQQLIDDLTSAEIKPTDDGRIQLQSKEWMKKQGIPSPNDADALALTFAADIVRIPAGSGPMANTRYDLFGD